MDDAIGVQLTLYSSVTGIFFNKKRRFDFIYLLKMFIFKYINTILLYGK